MSTDKYDKTTSKTVSNMIKKIDSEYDELPKCWKKYICLIEKQLKESEKVIKSIADGQGGTLDTIQQICEEYLKGK